MIDYLTAAQAKCKSSRGPAAAPGQAGLDEPAKDQSVQKPEEQPAEAVKRLRTHLGSGPIVCIAGSTQLREVETAALIKAIATEVHILGATAKFVTGGLPGVQQTFADEFPDGNRLFHMLPFGQKSGFQKGTDIFAGKNLEERIQVFTALGDVFLFFEGGPKVAQEAQAALDKGAGIVPLMRTGGASSGLMGFPKDALTDRRLALLHSGLRSKARMSLLMRQHLLRSR